MVEALGVELTRSADRGARFLLETPTSAHWDVAIDLGGYAGRLAVKVTLLG